MTVLGSSNSIENKDTISKIWTNWDTIMGFGRKYIVGKEEIARYAVCC